jgi:hypothetical protein
VVTLEETRRQFYSLVGGIGTRGVVTLEEPRCPRLLPVRGVGTRGLTNLEETRRLDSLVAD